MKHDQWFPIASVVTGVLTEKTPDSYTQLCTGIKAPNVVNLQASIAE